MTISSKLDNIETIKSNIKSAIEAKGVTVESNTAFSDYPTKISNIVELKGETKTVNPTTSQQTITPSTGKNGITEITVNAVTSAIDSNIVASNIKSGVTILGVQGTNQGGDLQTKNLTVNSTTPTEVTLTPDAGYYGLGEVDVDMSYYEDELDDVLTGSVTASSLEATNYLNAIRDALIAIGADIDNTTPYSQYATKIGEISMGAKTYLINNGVNGYYNINEDSGWVYLTYKGDTTGLTYYDYVAAQQYVGACYYYRQIITLPFSVSGYFTFLGGTLFNSDGTRYVNNNSNLTVTLSLPTEVADQANARYTISSISGNQLTIGITCIGGQLPSGLQYAVHATGILTQQS